MSCVCELAEGASCGRARCPPWVIPQCFIRAVPQPRSPGVLAPQYPAAGALGVPLSPPLPLQATATDQLVGFGLVTFSLVLFVYYTLWIIVLVRGSPRQCNPSQVFSWPFLR